MAQYWLDVLLGAEDGAAKSGVREGDSVKIVERQLKGDRIHLLWFGQLRAGMILASSMELFQEYGP